MLLERDADLEALEERAALLVERERRSETTCCAGSAGRCPLTARSLRRTIASHDRHRPDVGAASSRCDPPDQRLRRALCATRARRAVSAPIPPVRPVSATRCACSACARSWSPRSSRARSRPCAAPPDRSAVLIHAERRLRRGQRRRLRRAAAQEGARRRRDLDRQHLPRGARLPAPRSLMLRCRCLHRRRRLHARHDEYPIVPVVLTIGAAVGAAAFLRLRPKPEGYRMTLEWRAYDAAAQALDDRYGWDKLPKPISLGVLIGLRNLLRQHNLYDTRHAADGRSADAPRRRRPTTSPAARRTARYNDLDDPAMGMAGMRFGRNVPLDEDRCPTERRLLEPNPRVVSRELLTRESSRRPPRSTPGRDLAAVHDQGLVQPRQRPTRAPLPAAARRRRPVADAADAHHAHAARPDHAARQQRARRPTSTPRRHWWDGSQIYGTDADQQKLVRTGEDGKLRDRAGRHRPAAGRRPEHDPAMVPGFWLGLARCCTPLRARAQRDLRPPARPIPELVGRRSSSSSARLINAALLAKIHTVEWTPAIISHPTTQYRDAGELVRRWPASACTACSGGSATARSSAASPARRPTTTACRTRSPRSSPPSTACTR